MSSPIDPSDLESVAIFPLPGVVLFPGAVMPLHIFEPRYREMTQDALSGSRLIAMARIREPASEPRPEVFDVAGLGKLEAASELEDGRFIVLLRGVARVSISEELPCDTNYRQVRAELRPDTEPESVALARASEAQLISLCDQLAEAIAEPEKLREVVRLGSSLGERSDLIAATLVQDPDERQALLEMRDPGERLDKLLELVAAAMSDVGVDRHMN